MAKSNLASSGSAGGKASQRLQGIRGDGARHGPLELDRLIHERMRLAIVSALAVNDSLSFNELKRLLETTDGNLSVHARKLEEADYIVVHQVVRGPGAPNRVSLESAGSPRAGALPRPHGSADPQHPGALSHPFFEDQLYVAKTFAHQTRWPPCRDHHGRQRSLGHPAGASPRRRTSRGSQRGAASGGGGPRRRRRDPHVVRLLLGQLAAAGGRSRLAHATVPRAPPGRDGALCGQRRTAGDHRPARPARPRPAAGRGGRGGCHRGRRPAAAPDRHRLFRRATRSSGPPSASVPTPSRATRSGAWWRSSITGLRYRSSIS